MKRHLHKVPRLVDVPEEGRLGLVASVLKCEDRIRLLGCIKEALVKR